MAAKQSAAIDKALELVRQGIRPAHAAKQAGVSQSALWQAMKRHGLAFKCVLVENKYQQDAYDDEHEHDLDTHYNLDGWGEF